MGPKSKKKTKEQLAEERLARELEEKKQRELEEKRQMVEAEKRRVEELKIAEMRRSIRSSELDRLRSEYDARLAKQEAWRERFLAEDAKESDERDWVDFSNPLSRPHPEREREVNTFISQIQENEANTLADAMKICSQIEQVAHPMIMKWGNDVATQNQLLQQRSSSYVEILSNLLLEKIDDATVQVLRMVDLHVNDKSDKAELNLESSSGRVWVGLWGYMGTQPLNRKTVEFPKMGFEISVPRPILQHEVKFVHRVIRYPFESQSMAAYQDTQMQSNGNMSKYVIGDLHIVELLYPPPKFLTIRAKKWIIRDRSPVSMSLRRSTYPSTATTKCTMRVPDEIIMSEDIRVALWNADSRDWTENGITDYQWNEADRKVEFYLTALGTIGLVRDRAADMPYRSWSLRAIHDDAEDEFYEQHARFSLQTKTALLVIDVVGSSCRLVSPEDNSTADIIGKSMSPGALCALLQRKGINVMPTQREIHRVLKQDSKVKDSELEDAVLKEIAMLANSVDFEGSSDWNSALKSTQIGILAQESTAFTCHEEAFDFDCILAERDDASESHLSSPAVGTLPSPGVRFTLVLGNDYGTKSGFSLQPRPNEVSHMDLTAALTSRTTEECRERVYRARATFQNTVFRLLRLVRPLSLCQLPTMTSDDNQ